MTRLGRAERDVLDTVILCGIAHNRSQSVNWTIQAFGRGQQDWLGQIREAANSLSTIKEQCMNNNKPIKGDEPSEPVWPSRTQAMYGPIITG